MTHDKLITAGLHTPDDGVAIPTAPVRKRGRPKDETLKAQVDKFLSLKPGQSFFVEGAKRDDLLPLRKQVIAAGAGMQSVEVDQDEIFGTAGVRSWRLEGTYDQL